jgi:hypothetical protein
MGTTANAHLRANALGAGGDDFEPVAADSDALNAPRL